MRNATAKYLRLIVFSIVSALLLIACSSGSGKSGWYDEWGSCAAAGAAAGLAAGATDDFDSSMAGAAGGFIVGGVICAMSDTDADGVKNYMDDCSGTPAGGIVDSRGCEIDSDGDGDGVVDRLDECPYTPAGASVDARGCENDNDGDGVIDWLDRCPRTPSGAVVDAHGCELDNDGDGVVDRLDKCPNTYSGTAVDNTGCKLAEKFKLEGVNFEFDSVVLTADSTATLDAAIMILKRHADLEVEIAGHTDNHGDTAYNQGLSERRAQAVADYLQAHGANADNISVHGYGESEPISDNGLATGRAANRRVELRHE